MVCEEFMPSRRQRYRTNCRVPDAGAGTRTLLICFLTSLAGLFPLQALSEGDELRDAGKILAKKTGVVKKRAFSPEMAVLNAGHVDIPRLHCAIQLMNLHAGLAIDARAGRKDLRSIGGTSFFQIHPRSGSLALRQANSRLGTGSSSHVSCDAWSWTCAGRWLAGLDGRL